MANITTKQHLVDNFYHILPPIHAIVFVCIIDE